MTIECEHLYRHLETKRFTKTDFNQHKQIVGTNYICLDRFYCQKCLDIKEIRKEEYAKVLEIIPEWHRR